MNSNDFMEGFEMSKAALETIIREAKNSMLCALLLKAKKAGILTPEWEELISDESEKLEVVGQEK